MKIRGAVEAAEHALTFTIDEMKPGCTELDLAKSIRKSLINEGAGEEEGTP